MNKLVVFLMGLLLLVNGASAFTGSNLTFSQQNDNSVNFERNSASHFVIKDIRQDPFPANPGSYLDLYLRVENTGGNIDNPKFELRLSSPLSLDSINNVEQFPALGSGDKLTLHYKINIDKDAFPGEYDLEFRAYGSENLYYPYFFKIKVDDVTTDFDVALQDVTKDGVAIAISNIGKNNANAITVRLDNQQDFELLGIPSYIIGNLNSGDYTIINTLLKPKDNTGNKVLKLSIDYTDIIGTRRTLEKEIPIFMTVQTKKGFEDLTASVVSNGQEQKNQGSSKLFMYASLILAAALIGVVIRNRRKNKNEE